MKNLLLLFLTLFAVDLVGQTCQSASTSCASGATGFTLEIRKNGVVTNTYTSFGQSTPAGVTYTSNSQNLPDVTLDPSQITQGTVCQSCITAVSTSCGNATGLPDCFQVTGTAIVNVDLCDPNCNESFKYNSIPSGNFSVFNSQTDLVVNHFDVAYNGNDIVTPVDLTIDYGDGTVIVLPNAVTATTLNLTGTPPHIYASSGTYVIKHSFTSNSGLLTEFYSVVYYGNSGADKISFYSTPNFFHTTDNCPDDLVVRNSFISAQGTVGNGYNGTSSFVVDEANNWNTYTTSGIQTHSEVMTITIDGVDTVIESTSQVEVYCN